MLLAGTAPAQSLISLAPPGAVGGLYLADLSQSPYFKGIVRDWKESGLEAWLRKNLEGELGKGSYDALGFAQGGMAALLYPDGGFLLIAKPSPAAMRYFKKDARGLKPRGSWLVTKDKQMLTGFSKELVLFASPNWGEQFLSGKRGLRSPVGGHMGYWAEIPQSLISQMNEVPPRLGLSLSAIKRVGYSLTLTAGGFTTESRIEVDAAADPVLAKLVLPSEKPWSLGDFPSGYSGSVGLLDMPLAGRYVSGLLADLKTTSPYRLSEAKIKLDFRAFGNHYAMISVPGPAGKAGQSNFDNPLGHSLVYLEVIDQATAEANLLGLLQNIAAFATPEGKGGFKVLGNEGAFKAVEVGLLGNIYYRFDKDRLVIATSKEAIAAEANPPWKTQAGFQRFAPRVPANAVAYAFVDNQRGMEESFAILKNTLPMAIGTKADSKQAGELNQSLVSFLERTSKRFGYGFNYSVVQGSALVSKGFYEVNWK